MAGNIYIDSASGSGDMTYAVNPYAMAKGLERLNYNLVVTNLITNYSQEARNQGTRMSANVRVPKECFKCAAKPQELRKLSTGCNNRRHCNINTPDSRLLS